MVGRKRTCGVDKMDTEGQCQERKTGERLGVRCAVWGGVNRCRKDHGFALETSEMVVNSYLKDMERRTRLDGMWKLVPQV